MLLSTELVCLSPASTQNLCFGSQIRKNSFPLHTPVLLYKGGLEEGIYSMDMFS